jgi:hypothetical protein
VESHGYAWVDDLLVWEGVRIVARIGTRDSGLGRLGTRVLYAQVTRHVPGKWHVDCRDGNAVWP